MRSWIRILVFPILWAACGRNGLDAPFAVSGVGVIGTAGASGRPSASGTAGSRGGMTGKAGTGATGGGAGASGGVNNCRPGREASTMGLGNGLMHAAIAPHLV